MNKLIFHRKFLPITKIRETTVSLSSVTDLHNYIDALFPVLSNHIKIHKNLRYSFLINGKTPIPTSWILQNKILDTSCDIYIVPTIAGGTADMATTFANIDWTKILVQAALGTALSIGLSFIVRALLPKPKKPNEEAVDRKENDVFGSIVNTTDTNTSIALNYGLLRLGGQIISSDIETLTDQRIPDPVAEDIGSQDGTGELGGAGADTNTSNFGFDFGAIADVAATTSDITNPGPSGLGPDTTGSPAADGT